MTFINIIAGTFKGKKLKVLDENMLRPTSIRVRQVLFDWLATRIQWHDKTVLDLFAGTGALALEAISRGAKHVTCIEKNRTIYNALQKTKKDWQLKNMENINTDAFTFCSKNQQQFDVILLDPPYQTSDYQQIIQTILPLLKSGGFVFLESSKKLNTEPLLIEKESKAGSVYFYLCKSEL